MPTYLLYLQIVFMIYKIYKSMKANKLNELKVLKLLYLKIMFVWNIFNKIYYYLNMKLTCYMYPYHILISYLNFFNLFKENIIDWLIIDCLIIDHKKMGRFKFVQNFISGYFFILVDKKKKLI